MRETKSDVDEDREQVFRQVLSADTLPEIEAAKQILREWMKEHPEEQGMRAGFERLYTIQEIIENEESARGALTGTPARHERRYVDPADNPSAGVCRI